MATAKWPGTVPGETVKERPQRKESRQTPRHLFRLGHVRSEDRPFATAHQTSAAAICDAAIALRLAIHPNCIAYIFHCKTQTWYAR